MAQDVVAIREEIQAANGIVRTKFAICEPVGFLIPSGADGSGVSPAILPAHPRVLAISCEDTGGIAASTDLSAQVAWDTQASSALVDLYEQDDPSTQWSKGSLPVSGAFGFILTHAFRIRQIRLILSVNATADLMFKIYGLDGVV